MGTFGYLAPEYFMYGKVSDKIDVYAFGIVLLELLSGRKPISSDTPKGQESLVMWVRRLILLLIQNSHTLYALHFHFGSVLKNKTRPNCNDAFI